MKETPLATIKYSDGFASSYPEDYEGDILNTGSQNLIYLGEERPTAFKGPGTLSGTGARQLFSFADNYAGLADSGGTSGKGSVFAGPGISCVYIGAGNLVVNGTSLATAAATTLALRLLSGGSYTSGSSGPYTAGLAAPTAGTLSAKPATVGTLTGAISIKHTWVRNSTGAEGNASNASNSITFAAQVGQYAITETAPNGADRARIYASPRGFATTGPHYFYVEKAVTSFRRTLTDIVTNGTTTITSATANWTTADVGATVVLSGGGSLTTTIASRTNATDVVLNSAPGWSTSGNTGVISDLIDLDFSDADLQARLAPIDYNVPPVGVFAFQIESVWCVAGAYGDITSGVTATNPGNSIAISRVNRYEAFPADFLIGLPAAPTGIAQRTADGMVFVWGSSYLGGCSFTGGTPPVAFRVIWPFTGFPAPHSACVANNELYGFSSKRGPVRIGPDGEPDMEFARKVQKTVEGWTPANVVVGWDADNTQVCFMHGSTILPFNTAEEKWGAPADISASPMSISGSIISAAANGSSMAFCANNSGTFTPYAYNTGTTGSVWKARSSHRSGGSPESQKTLGTIKSTFRHDNLTTPNVTTKILKNYNTSSVQKTITTVVTAAGAQHMAVGKGNVRNVKSFCVEQQGQSNPSTGDGDSGPVKVVVLGTVNSVRK